MMRLQSDLNVTPMIDVLLYGEIVGALEAAKGTGADRVGIVTERMRG